MNVLITGASGHLSSFLFEEADRGNHDVWGVDIAPARHPSAKDRVKIIDVREQDMLKEAMEGTDAVIHTAAQISVQSSLQDPVTDGDINVLGTVSALQAAVDAGVKKFIFISSAAVYGNPVRIPITELHPTGPLSPYGAAKLAAEGYVRMFERTHGIETVIIRPFNFYSSRADMESSYSGVITKFIKDIKKSQRIIVSGDGSQTRDFIHASDVARMIFLALESEVSGTTLNCGSGKETSIAELAETLAELSAKDISIEYSESKEGEIMHSTADMWMAEELLDFRASVTLKEGLAECLNQLSAKTPMSMQ